MEGLLKKSTAVNVTVLMIDSSDHITGKTGLAAGLTIYATKAAGTPATITPTVTELDATNVKGLYKLALTSSHTDTDGELQLHITATGADPTDIKWQVGAVDANLIQILGTLLTETAGQIAAGFKKVFDVASPVFTAASVNQTGDSFARIGAPAGASESADIAAIKALLPAALVGGRMDSSVGAMAANVLTATAINADAITAAKIADGAIDAATFAAGAINAAAIAADAITDAKVAADVTIASVTGAVGSVTGNVGGSVGSVAAGGIAAASFAAGAIDAAAIATDALGSLELAAGAASEIASAVRTELTTELGRIDVATSTRLASASYTAPDNADIAAIKAKTDNLPSDPADESLIIAATDAIMGRLGPPAGASVSADVAAVKSDTGAIKAKTDNLPASPAATSDIPTAAANADAVWEEAIADHDGTAGSTAEALAAAGAAGDPWATALPGSYGAGTAGKIVGDNLDAAVSSRSTYAGADTAGTTTLLARLTAARAGYLDNLSAGAVALEASLQGLITTIGAAAAGVATAVWGAATRVLTAGTNIVLAKGTGLTGLNDLSAAQVNAEADTALADAGVTTAVTGRIDVAVSSRLAAGSYTAPDNAGIGVAAAAAASAATSAGSAATDAGTLVGRLTSGRAANLDNLDGPISGLPSAAENADGLLARNIAGGSNGGHIVTDALRPLRNRTEIVGSDLNVYEEDGATLAWTAPISRAPGDPLASIDPA